MKVRTGETEQEPNLHATYPIGPSSTIDPALFYRLACGLLAVVFAIFSKYLGVGTSICNARAKSALQRRFGTQAMTTFDKREEAFEKKFVLDEEDTFKAVARRNRLLGLWVADKLGKAGTDADAYSREVVAAEFEDGGDKAVMRKLMGDLSAKGIAISEEEVLQRMAESFVIAIAQVKAGT